MISIETMRRVLPAALTALALVAGGCGGGGGDGGATADDSAAGLVPATVPVFVALETDLDSEQWNTLETLLDKFPGKERLLAQLRASLAEEGVDFERDVRPALGDELDVVWLDLAGGGENVVALTRPRDEEKLDQLLEKGDDPPVRGEVEGWTVVADDQATLDRFEQARGDDSLADSEIFA